MRVPRHRRNTRDRLLIPVVSPQPTIVSPAMFAYVQRQLAERVAALLSRPKTVEKIVLETATEAAAEILSNPIVPVVADIRAVFGKFGMTPNDPDDHLSHANRTGLLVKLSYSVSGNPDDPNNTQNLSCLSPELFKPGPKLFCHLDIFGKNHSWRENDSYAVRFDICLQKETVNVARQLFTINAEQERAAFGDMTSAVYNNDFSTIPTDKGANSLPYADFIADLTKSIFEIIRLREGSSARYAVGRVSETLNLAAPAVG